MYGLFFNTESSRRIFGSTENDPSTWGADNEAWVMMLKIMRLLLNPQPRTSPAVASRRDVSTMTMDGGGTGVSDPAFLGNNETPLSWNNAAIFAPPPKDTDYCLPPGLHIPSLVRLKTGHHPLPTSQTLNLTPARHGILPTMMIHSTTNLLLSRTTDRRSS